MHIKGTLRLDQRTKRLAKRLKPGEIALIDHEDIDSNGAQMLVDAKARAVINASRSCTGRYPNSGPMLLLRAGIPIIDSVDHEPFKLLSEGDQIEIKDNQIIRKGAVLFKGELLNENVIAECLKQSRANLSAELEKFVENTLSYVTNEQSILLDPTSLPEVRTPINDKHVLVVVRGESYKQDLATIMAYVRDVRPVLVGVDGGADALLEAGLKPNIIVGDMDSVSDQALRSGAELIVQAYADGKAPGLERLEKLGLKAAVCSVPGTSEDLALLLAFEKGAELIVAVGTHSTLVDFLDKGRQGMSSTFLARLKVGHRLVDARGVSKLYRDSHRMRYIAVLAAAAFVLMLTVIALSPNLQDRLMGLMEDVRSLSWRLYTNFKLWRFGR